MTVSTKQTFNNLNKFCIGAAQFGMDYGIMNQTGRLQSSDIKSILDHATENGIDTIDTAISYGNSEINLGNYGLSNFKVVTKLPPLNNHIANVQNWIFGNVKKSIQNLRQSSLYALLIHNCNDLYGNHRNEILDSLNYLKDKKIVKNVGVSVYAPEDVTKILEVMVPDIIQIPVNVFDRRFEESGCLKLLSELKTKIYARSIFLQGVALQDFDKLPEYFYQWKDHFMNWKNFLNHAEIDPVTGCLQYSMSIKEIDKIIIGLDNQKQFIEIISAAKNCIYDIKIPSFGDSDTNLINPTKWKAS